MWPPSTVGCSHCALQCGDETNHWGNRLPTRAPHELAASLKRTNVGDSSAIISRPYTVAVEALMLVAPIKKQHNEGLYKQRYARGTNTKGSSNKPPQ